MRPRPGTPASRTAQQMLVRYWRRIALLVVAVIAVIVVAGILEQRSEDADRASEIRADLFGRGVTSEQSHELAAALRNDGISADAAAAAVAALRATFGAADLSDREAAGLLAAWEESDTAPHDSASRTLSQIGSGLGATREGFAAFVRTVTDEVTERELPPAVILAGLSEHVYEYQLACELVEGAPCPLEVAIDLVADRQQADYGQWGHVDCLHDENVAHPGCVTFADCAAEYAVVITANETWMEAQRTASDLGHDFGTDGWLSWTAQAAATADQARNAHEACIDDSYGEDIVEAYKSLVLAR